MPAVFGGGASLIRPLSVGAGGAPGLSRRRSSSASSHALRVPGWWKLNSRRARASGARPFVNQVSMPVLSYRNGSGRTGTWSGFGALAA